ncbi:hypothetical protein [Kitasatospora cathayae]|uniref:Uncharacterized protein n=1 Tax=Kitasatospora cathayae TaxID=3004092 RepID=A0ABY7QGZ2_9ACTN|nr:hypothetical protein [Kitasatospora sp. HUAS 3-15]WBP91988.1 hypothetical protein O1G21_40060 [Kitasatospora sp. HUAS 3-15]
MPKLDRARHLAGRAATAAGAAALTASIFTPHVLPVATPVVLGTTALSAAVSIQPWRRSTPGVLSALYATPSAILLGEMVAFRIIPGVHWGEGLAVAVWAGVTWWQRPSHLARELVRPSAAVPATPDYRPQDLVPTTPAEHLVCSWAQWAQMDRSPAAGTFLEHAAVEGRTEWRAQIVAEGGRPVPDIPIAAISAITNIPEEFISIKPVKGHGAGRRQLVVTERTGADVAQQEMDPFTRWEKEIAPGAMPHSQLIAIRRGNTKTGEMEEVLRPE